MHARQTTVSGKPDQIDAGIKQFEEVTVPAIRQLAGFAGVQFIADRKHGKVIVTSYWESQQELLDSEAKVAELRKAAAAAAGSTTPPIVEHFEVVMVDIKHPVHA